MKTTFLVAGMAVLVTTSWKMKTGPGYGNPKTPTGSSVAIKSPPVFATNFPEKINEDPLETINRWFTRFKAGASAEELAGFYAEDAVMWIPGDTGNIPWIGKRTGRKDIAEHYKVLWKNIKSEKLVITDMLAKGNRVVVLGHLESRYLGNNNLIDSDFCMNIIVENGQIKSYSFLEDSFDVSQKVKGTKPLL